MQRAAGTQHRRRPAPRASTSSCPAPPSSLTSSSLTRSHPLTSPCLAQLPSLQPSAQLRQQPTSGGATRQWQPLSARSSFPSRVRAQEASARTQRRRRPHQPTQSSQQGSAHPPFSPVTPPSRQLHPLHRCHRHTAGQHPRHLRWLLESHQQSQQRMAQGLSRTHMLDLRSHTRAAR